MRVFDLGCGSGRDLASWGVTAPDELSELKPTTAVAIA